MGDNSIKNSRIKILKPHAHHHIIGRKSIKFQVNPMKVVGGVAETRSLGWTDGRTMIGRKSSKFQMNPMKGVGGVGETRSWLAKFKSA